MIRFEIESDRDVLVDGIGLLPAGEPVEVSEDMLRDFQLRNGVKLAGANFASHVKVTAIVQVEDKPEVEEVPETEEVTEESTEQEGETL